MNEEPGYGFRFSFQYKKGGREVIVKEPDIEANVTDMVEVFEAFLTACGYSIEKGDLKKLMEEFQGDVGE